VRVREIDGEKERIWRDRLVDVGEITQAMGSVFTREGDLLKARWSGD
jgi:hypothetical protein